MDYGWLQANFNEMRQTCYICLLFEVDEPKYAVTSVKGTAVCLSHIKWVGNTDVLAAYQ